MKVLVDRIDTLDVVPKYVRLSVNAPMPPGRAIDCLVLLRPPEGPLAPRSFDFARRAYFLRIGATGITLGRCRPTAAPAPSGWWEHAVLSAAALRRDGDTLPSTKGVL